MIQVSARGELAQYRAIIGINGGRDSGHNPKRGKRTQSAKRETQPTKRESKRGGGKCSTTTIQAQSIGGGCRPNGKGRVASKKISVQNPQKRFGLAESFGSQKIFRKNFGKTKKGFVSKGRIFGGSGKNLSGVILFDCYYLSLLLGKWFGLWQKRADRFGGCIFFGTFAECNKSNYAE